MFKGNFVKNLPKIYGTYTGGFLVFIILMAIAEQAGMTKETIGILFVAFTPNSSMPIMAPASIPILFSSETIKPERFKSFLLLIPMIEALPTLPLDH